MRLLNMTNNIEEDFIKPEEMDLSLAIHKKMMEAIKECCEGKGAFLSLTASHMAISLTIGGLIKSFDIKDIPPLFEIITSFTKIILYSQTTIVKL